VQILFESDDDQRGRIVGGEPAVVCCPPFKMPTMAPFTMPMEFGHLGRSWSSWWRRSSRCRGLGGALRDRDTTDDEEHRPPPLYRRRLADFSPRCS